MSPSSVDRDLVVVERGPAALVGLDQRLGVGAGHLAQPAVQLLRGEAGQPRIDHYQ